LNTNAETDILTSSQTEESSLPANVSSVNKTSLQVKQASKRQELMTPMTREEYETQQSQIRQVFDPETGRYRLIRGMGEIIESIVSWSQHAAINQMATRGDGASFARQIYLKANPPSASGRFGQS